MRFLMPPMDSLAESLSFIGSGESAGTMTGSAVGGRRSAQAWITASGPGTLNISGVIEEPHINTYDIGFWGADSMCASLYLGALKAATLMGKALGDN